MRCSDISPTSAAMNRGSRPSSANTRAAWSTNRSTTRAAGASGTRTG